MAFSQTQSFLLGNRVCRWVYLFKGAQAWFCPFKVTGLIFLLVHLIPVPLSTCIHCIMSSRAASVCGDVKHGCQCLYDGSLVTSSWSAAVLLYKHLCLHAWLNGKSVCFEHSSATVSYQTLGGFKLVHFQFLHKLEWNKNSKCWK